MDQKKREIARLPLKIYCCLFDKIWSKFPDKIKQSALLLAFHLLLISINFLNFFFKSLLKRPHLPPITPS